MSSVRAAVCPEYGPPAVVRVQEHTTPETGRGQVRVRVRAASVNFPDVLLIAGTYQVSVPPPFVPGSEFTGIVTEVGADCTAFAEGDRVAGTSMCGAFADDIVVEPGSLSRIAEHVDDHTAATFGVAYRTAYHTLRSTAALRPGEQIVVLGAGGGIGLATVQLARQLGAEVTAVASSTEKLATAAAFGATHLVNHSTADLRHGLKSSLPEGADVVVDPVGGRLTEPALRGLRRGGRFITLGYASGVIPRIPLNLVLVKGLHVLGFQFQNLETEEFRRNEEELAALVHDEHVRPHIGAVYPLSQVTDALSLVASGKAVGKVVLDMR